MARNSWSLLFLATVAAATIVSSGDAESLSAAAAAATSTLTTSSKFENRDRLLSNLIKWFQDGGGSMHPSVRLVQAKGDVLRNHSDTQSALSGVEDIKSSSSSSGSAEGSTVTKGREGISSLSPFAWFLATADIAKGDTLLFVPKELILDDRENSASEVFVIDHYGDLQRAMVKKLRSGVEGIKSDDDDNDDEMDDDSSDFDTDAGQPAIYYDVSVFGKDSDGKLTVEEASLTSAEMDRRCWDCATLRRVVAEIQRHSQNSSSSVSSSSSPWGPYLEYLFQTLREKRWRPPLLSFWSDLGRAAFSELIGGKHPQLIEQQEQEQSDHRKNNPFPSQLPPLKWDDWYDEELVGRCDGGDADDGKDLSELETEAFQLVMQLAWQTDRLVPFVDLLRHSSHPTIQNVKIVAANSSSNNTVNAKHHDEDVTNDNEKKTNFVSSVRVVASRVIEAGEVLYTSYENFYKFIDDDDEIENDDSDDENEIDMDVKNKIDRWSKSFGTPELLRVFGVVEELPQRWVFHKQKIAFDLVRVDELGEEGEQKSIAVKWISSSEGQDDDDDDDHEKQKSDGRPNTEGMLWMQEHLARLETLQEYFAVPGEIHTNLPYLEWKVLSSYHVALVTALKHAIKAAAVDDEPGGQVCEGGLAQNALTCKAPSSYAIGRFDYSQYYDPLVLKHEIWGDDRPDTCPTRALFHVEDWVTLEELQSHYQKIKFEWNPIDEDTCFRIEQPVQICTSYRPHYHDMMVHYTARFLGANRLQRVLFVGGGDSMILHEVLKYPLLELVVGLEIDQVVTRKSFQYFGTQPHFDDERVEWWFGDASKSLLMLPRDYFGSFDLVLVDLSETVASISVTDDLDITGALSLLLKPDGIMLKNEFVYFKAMSEIFEYTLHVHYYDVPFVCSQSMIMGRNNVGFFHQKQTDHKIEYMFNLLDEIDTYNIVRDYQRNESSSTICKDEQQPEKEVSTQQKSPGILMIVEAEKATIEKFTTAESVKKVIVQAVENESCKIRSVVAYEIENNRQVVVIMDEGYIVARFFPDQKYFAFDIHLWSSFDKQDNLRKSLVESVGSTVHGPSSSSFRIVAGGLFGIDMWKSDEIKRGPVMTQVCKQPKAFDHRQLIPQKHHNLILTESLKLVQDEVDASMVVVVLCGLQSEVCESINALKLSSSTVIVQPLWSCAEFGDNDYDFNAIAACEGGVVDMLKAMSAKERKIRALIVDSSARLGLAQIILKIFSRKLAFLLWLNSPEFMVSAFVYDESESWRKAFVQKFRENIFNEEPVFTAEVLFNSTESSTAFVVTMNGNYAFPGRLLSFSRAVETQAPELVADLRSIRGGEYLWIHDLTPSQFFRSKDFDNNDATSQWRSQQPLGSQSVYQLESGNEEFSALSLKVVLEFLEKSTSNQAFSSSGKGMETNEISLGHGSVIAVLWWGGSLVVLWDGRKHVDVNIFTYEGDEGLEEKFMKPLLAFLDQTNNGLKIVLQDDHPRGIGRVVNFPRDIKSQRHFAFG